MNIWIELLLALGLLFFIALVRGYLQDFFGSEKETKKHDVNPRKGVDFIGVAVTFLCHDGEGNYITYKRSQSARDEQGNWDIGSGSVEYGERVEDTLRREIKEEFKADVVSFEVLGFRDVHRTLSDGRPTHWIGLDYKVQVVREQVGIGEPDAIDEIRWWRSVEEIPTPRHSQLGTYLELYKNKL